MNVSEVGNRLRRMLESFVLRRTKADVLVGGAALLPIIEFTVYVELTTEQQDYHQQLINRDPLLRKKISAGAKKPTCNMFAPMTKCAHHPFIIDGFEPPSQRVDQTLIDISCKHKFLVPLLEKLQQAGSKVLMLVEYRESINILADICRFKGFTYVTMDGDDTMKRRKTVVKKFQTKDKFLFIATIGTGGIGLNLQAADCVVILDSAWNPQVDQQAICRAHRIGQTKQVKVIRIVAENTIDEYKYATASVKSFMDDVLLGRPAHDKVKISLKQRENSVCPSAILNMFDLDVARTMAATQKQRTQAEWQGKMNHILELLKNQSKTTTTTTTTASDASTEVLKLKFANTDCVIILLNLFPILITYRRIKRLVILSDDVKK